MQELLPPSHAPGRLFVGLAQRTNQPHIRHPGRTCKAAQPAAAMDGADSVIYQQDYATAGFASLMVCDQIFDRLTAGDMRLN